MSRLKEYPYISKFLLLLFAGYVLIWYLQIGQRIKFLGAIRIEFLYAVFLALMAFTVREKKFSSPISKYVVAYLIALIIQIPFSYDPSTSFLVFYNRIIKFSFIAFFITVFVKSPTGLRYFLTAFLLACMKIGQEGLIGKITGSMVWENQGVMRLHGTTSLYDHPNSLSGNAIGTLPFLLFLFPIVPLLVQLALAMQAIFAANIILFTASRTGYVAILVFLLFVIKKKKSNPKVLFALVVFVLIGIQFIPVQYIERFQSIFSGQEAEGHSSEKRMQIIKDAVNIFITHPLGVGVGAFPKIRRDTFGRSQDTHNLYLEVATNLGIQGFMIFFFLVYKMLKTLQSLGKDFSRQIETLKGSNETGELRSHVKDLNLMKATSEAVYVFIILRLALGLFGMDLYEVYWWFAIGLTIALYNMNKISNEKTMVLKDMNLVDAAPEIRVSNA